MLLDFIWLGDEYRFCTRLFLVLIPRRTDHKKWFADAALVGLLGICGFRAGLCRHNVLYGRIRSGTVMLDREAISFALSPQLYSCFVCGGKHTMQVSNLRGGYRVGRLRGAAPSLQRLPAPMLNRQSCDLSVVCGDDRRCRTGNWCDCMPTFRR